MLDLLHLPIKTEAHNQRRLAQRAEKDLQIYLSGKDSTSSDIAHFLAQYIFHTPSVWAMANLTLEDTARRVKISYCKTLSLP